MVAPAFALYNSESCNLQALLNGCDSCVEDWRLNTMNWWTALWDGVITLASYLMPTSQRRWLWGAGVLCQNSISILEGEIKVEENNYSQGVHLHTLGWKCNIEIAYNKAKSRLFLLLKLGVPLCLQTEIYSLQLEQQHQNHLCLKTKQAVLGPLWNV